MEIQQTPKGNPKLSSGGYVYRKDRENNKTQKTLWRCVWRRGCQGRAHTQWCVREQRFVVQITKEHSHAPESNDVDAVEWVERLEVRKSAPAVVIDLDTPHRCACVNASTQLSRSALPELAVSARTDRKRKVEELNISSDLDFDVDLNVDCDLSPHRANFSQTNEECSFDHEQSSGRRFTDNVPLQVQSMTEFHPREMAKSIVLARSETPPEGTETVRGYDFNQGVDYHKLFCSYTHTGFQATNVGKAIEEINRMIDCKMQPLPESSMSEININPCGREKSNCTIFLSYTSNMISAGTREIIRYLVQHNMVDCIVTSAGGIEEDFIKCLGPTYLGDFALRGKDLRAKGINRIGNLLVPNNNYCMFEDWLNPILDTMIQEQKEQQVVWTPSKIISRLGKEIQNTESVYYWAYKNNIPVFCPALTDGSLGDVIFFHSYKNPGLVIDIVEDVRRMNCQAMHAANTGMIILGGGVCKHHTCNANLMRNGADYSVFVNTASEFDGSDSGAAPDEAVSWGKIKMTANPVKVYGEATVIFPIIVGETFARRQAEFKIFSQMH